MNQNQSLNNMTTIITDSFSESRNRLFDNYSDTFILILVFLLSHIICDYIFKEKFQYINAGLYESNKKFIILKLCVFLLIYRAVITLYMFV
jgi:hypothetical protein